MGLEMGTTNWNSKRLRTEVPVKEEEEAREGAQVKEIDDT
jgi:hypothetical protein